jgi:hypothetical protein
MPSYLLFLLIPYFSVAMAVSNPTTTTTKPKGGLPYPPILPAKDGVNKIIRDDATGDVRSVPTKMNYVTPETVEMHVRRDITGSDEGIEGCEFDPAEVFVRNARGDSKTLHDHGFELLQHPLDKKIDFMNTDEVIDHYYPTCEQLLQQVLGDKVTVKAFDHNVRISNTNDGPESKGSGDTKAQVPVGMVHGDYTSSSGPKRLDDLGQPPKANDVLKQRLGEQPLLDPTMVQEALAGKRRFSLINVWRNIDTEHPVGQLPLACVDATTAAKKDLRIFKIYYQDRVGQNYFVVPNKDHQWNYFRNMEHAEALLIKQWDSFGGFALGDDSNKVSTFAIHSAFLDASSSETAPPRRSIEVRCAILWEEEEP